jgi:hypothetical protein
VDVVLTVCGSDVGSNSVVVFRYSIDMVNVSGDGDREENRSGSILRGYRRREGEEGLIVYYLKRKPKQRWPAYH